ncbi:J domain-containing protein [Paraburkholderia kururiensis]|uniref:DnaJ domain-containing protein n=1 Tax=Paraburkholderia kururiensis TaxID=984307 RepID=A0ABZ0WF95_9BURK|nr:DnaJ domain-containing protein [Paraburkholderia kururiensis]WQD76026.1 DnaJ domain-containing protein [Paraburkholderia kururiensis]
MATLYELLGVADNASEDEIKRAYRKAAMKWHPDRNAGREDAARAAFQEIKDAYAILSDAHQRAVYDAVFAEEMRRWQSAQEKRERERAEREAAEQAAAEARYQENYRENVALAMRFADAGYNRDVLLGVLLGRDCDEELACRVADSVHAWQQARRAETSTEEQASEPDDTVPHEKENDGNDDKNNEDPAATPPHDTTSAEPHEERHSRLFNALWRGFFGLRS